MSHAHADQDIEAHRHQRVDQDRGQEEGIVMAAEERQCEQDRGQGGVDRPFSSARDHTFFRTPQAEQARGAEHQNADDDQEGERILELGRYEPGEENLDHPDGKSADYGPGQAVEPAEDGACEGLDQHGDHHLEIEKQKRKRQGARSRSRSRWRAPTPSSKPAKPGSPSASRRERSSMAARIAMPSRVCSKNRYRTPMIAIEIPITPREFGEARTPPISTVSVGNSDGNL